MTLIKSIGELEQAVKSHSKVVLVLSSDTCPDCHYLDTFAQSLEDTFPDIAFYKVKRSDVPMLFTHYDVYGVPSIFYYSNGVLKDTYISKARKTFAMVSAFIFQAIKKEG